MVCDHTHVDRHRCGNLDRYDMAESVFLDLDVSLHRRWFRLPECVVLGETGEQTVVNPNFKHPNALKCGSGFNSDKKCRLTLHYFILENRTKRNRERNDQYSMTNDQLAND